MRRPFHAVLAVSIALWLLAVAGCGSKDTGEVDQAASETTEVVTPSNPEGDRANTAPLDLASDKPADPATIAMGETVDLASHLSNDRITVFDFTSKYCGPCRQIAPYLERLHKERSDIAVVKVDINRPGTRGIDWQSPVARQYGLRSIPHFKVFDAAGNLMAEGQAAQPLVFGWINELQTAGR